jgi:hypothetical protein
MPEKSAKTGIEPANPTGRRKLILRSELPEPLWRRPTKLTARKGNPAGGLCADEPLYWRRHKVENFLCRFKRHRRLSTRCEKLAITFLAFVQLAAVIDWLIH